MVWQKGQSGNPIGLNAKEAALKRRLHGLTFKAVDALEHALDSGTTSERIAAAREVFDRAIGKAKQQATVEVTHNASPHLVALTAMAAQTLARVSSAPEIEGQAIEITQHAMNLSGSTQPDLIANGGERDDD